MANIKSVSMEVSQKEKKAFELDEALDVAGFGVYSIKYCLLFSWFLVAAIVEPIGYSYILPASKCDLDLSDSLRGLIGSLPYIAIVLTSYPWGYAADVHGRKKMLVLSSMVCGTFATGAAFMPDLTSFIICKCLANICLACPSAIPYAFIGEILPRKHRDIALSVTNSVQMLGSALVPLLAWGILPLDINTNFGSYYFRSWRLLNVLYAMFMPIGGILMMFGPESPKYLISQGRHDEAMEVLRNMYAQNKGASPDDFPVKVLSMPAQRESTSLISSLKYQTLAVLRPPYVKWLLLNGILLFGIFSTLNGLIMWIPDVLNRVFSGDSDGTMTACEIIRRGLNETHGEETVCRDTIETSTFVINSIANSASALITLSISASLKVVSKKTLLHALYFVFGTFAIVINFIRQDIVFAVLLTSLPIMGTGVGPVNAFSVDIFPTHLRGMAVSLSLMIGRTGSVIGTNVTGILINTACEAAFYMFGGILLCPWSRFGWPDSSANGKKYNFESHEVCGCLTFLLPNAKRNREEATSNLNKSPS